jgi:hypothetical protein
MSQRKLVAAICILAAVGLARSLWFHAVAEPIGGLAQEARKPRAEQRYLALRPLLPSLGAVGYVSDEIVDLVPGSTEEHSVGTRLYQEALYALAPLILRHGDDRAPLVIANLRDPARLPAILHAHGLEPLVALAPGLALCRPAVQR